MAVQNRIAEQFEMASAQAQDTIESHPLVFVATAFGLGLVLGVVAVTSLQSTRASQQGMATRIGHRLMEALSQVTPFGRE